MNFKHECLEVRVLHSDGYKVLGWGSVVNLIQKYNLKNVDSLKDVKEQMFQIYKNKAKWIEVVSW